MKLIGSADKTGYRQYYLQNDDGKTVHLGEQPLSELENEELARQARSRFEGALTNLANAISEALGVRIEVDIPFSF